MVTVLTALVVLALVAVVVVLGWGMVNLARGGDPRRANVLMRWRVVLQGAALLLFMLLVTLIGR